MGFSWRDSLDSLHLELFFIVFSCLSWHSIFKGLVGFAKCSPMEICPVMVS